MSLLATCWTTAGDANPYPGDQRSPVGIRERIEAASDAGFRGMGLLHADLMPALDEYGVRGLRPTWPRCRCATSSVSNSTTPTRNPSARSSMTPSAAGGCAAMAPSTSPASSPRCARPVGTARGRRDPLRGTPQGPGARGRRGRFPYGRSSARFLTTRHLRGDDGECLVGLVEQAHAESSAGGSSISSAISVPSSPGLVHQRTAMASPISFAPRTRQSTDMITALWALIQSLRCPSFSAEPLPSAR